MIKKITILITLSFGIFVSISQTVIMGRQRVDRFPVINNTLAYGLTWLPEYYDNTTRRYPLIISLHGAGEAGSVQDSLRKLYTAVPYSISGRIANGWNPTAVNPLTGISDSFIVISPQSNSWSYTYNSLRYLLPNVLSRYRVDTSRVYITGLSAGGCGTYTSVANNDGDFIRKITAVATANAADVRAVNGLTIEEVESNIPDITPVYGIPVWNVSSELDFMLATSVRYHNLSNSKNTQMPNKFTVVAKVKHAVWGNLYDPEFRPTVNYYGNSGTCVGGCPQGGIALAPNDNGSLVRGSGKTQDSLSVYEWFLTKQRIFDFTAYAGNDQTITQPNSSVNLIGSFKNGGSVSYLWKQVSGPSIAVFSDSTINKPKVTQLIAGVYVFQLKVVELSTGKIATDDVRIKVNVVTDLQEQSNETDIELFPNPSTGILYLNNKETADVQILDVHGRICNQINDLKTGQTQINLQNESEGLYILKIISQGQTQIKQFQLIKE